MNDFYYDNIEYIKLMFVLTFLKAFRKFSDKKAYKTGLTHEFVYANICATICIVTVTWELPYKSNDLSTKIIWK